VVAIAPTPGEHFYADKERIDEMIDLPSQAEIERIKNDPKAGPEDIHSLMRVSIRDAMEHPNCTPDIWWMGARMFPTRAIASPAGRLFMLEDPGRWQKLVDDNAAGWLHDQMRDFMTDQRRVALAVDCVDHVKPIFMHQAPRRYHAEFQKQLEQWRAVGNGDIPYDKVSRNTEHKAFRALVVKWIAGLDDERRAKEDQTNRNKRPQTVGHSNRIPAVSHAPWLIVALALTSDEGSAPKYCRDAVLGYLQRPEQEKSSFVSFTSDNESVWQWQHYLANYHR
jgi:hypothetical protein